MEEKVKKYKSGELEVIWKPNVCIHSEKCWKGLPEVFKPKEKPWIQPDETSNEKIIEQIKKCPSGALDYEPKKPEKMSDDALKVDVIENGPLMVNGLIQIKKADGSLEEKSKAAFCRCGASSNKPYCDGSHNEVDFKG